MVTGWAALSKGQALTPLTYPVPPLGDHEVRVAVSHCGLCFTDVHAIDDFYGLTDYPFVPGHEIVGQVEAVGPSVTELSLGDRVGVGWQGRSCGHCRWCAEGEVQLCYDIADMGTWEHHGGFADSVTVDADFAYRLPVGMASDAAAVLMCAGTSVFNPLRSHHAPGRRLAVYGLGGLGHLAIQFGHALGYEVTALSSSPAKEQEALTLGAERFVVTGDRSRMRALDFEFDVVLCTAHGGVNWDEQIGLLEKRGRLVLVGFPEVTMDPTDLVAHEVSITGSFLANHTTMREMLSFADDHGIAPRLEHLPMGRVNEAIERLKANRVRYRVVLDRVEEGVPAPAD
jgi:uncharacterized zinc-type alcohol dehydrogenase-like protein